MLMIGALNSKGGVGKTLLSTALGVRAAADFDRVCVVDLDPQKGAERWFGFRKEAQLGDNPSVMVGEDRVVDAVEKLKLTGWDVAIFDGVPGALSRTEEAIELIDFVVIPLKAADQDMASTEYTVAACFKHNKPFLLVINEVTPGKNPDKRAVEVRETLVEALGEQYVAKTMIGRRVGFVDAVNMGKSVSEMKGQDVAAAEIDDLYREIIERAGKIARAA